MAEKMIFKKYENRRLYDTERSTYVTLNEISDLIRQGNRVEVLDAKTEEDVTAFVLTQIIVEEARKKNLLLPATLLHLIIQFGDNLLEEFFDKYLEQTIKNFLSYKATFDQQYRKMLDMGVDFSDTAQKTMTGMWTLPKSPFDFFPDSPENHEKIKKEK
jgi:polyhydroxyalkanoate synthesis repressor PhaR